MKIIAVYTLFAAVSLFKSVTACVEGNHSAFYDQDWTIEAVKGPNGELVGPGWHFYSNTAANLNNQLLFQWYTPNPADIDLRLNKLDFNTCMLPRDVSPQGLTLLTPTYKITTRKFSLPINLEPSTIQQSDVWDSSYVPPTANGGGQIKFCMQIQAYLKMDCQPSILITHFNTQVTFQILTTEGFALATQSLQCWTDEAQVIGSAQTHYLDTPYLCDSQMFPVNAPAGGYLPGSSFCFCVRTILAAAKEVYVYDVLNVTAVGAVTLNVDFANSPSPYFYKVCDYVQEICRVCVLLTDIMWPFLPCVPTCSTSDPSCNPTASCPQGGVNVTGFVNVAFGNGSNHPHLGRNLRAHATTKTTGNGFRMQGLLAFKTVGANKRNVRICTRSVLKACNPCTNSCLNAAVNACRLSAFKDSANLEKQAVLSACKKKCVHHRQ